MMPELEGNNNARRQRHAMDGLGRPTPAHDSACASPSPASNNKQEQWRGRQRGRRWAGLSSGTLQLAEVGGGAILNWLRVGGGGCCTGLRVP